MLTNLMAGRLSYNSMEAFLFLSFLLTLGCYNALAETPSAIYQFGDSISDTGNTVREDPSGLCGKPPYGETFFQHPTGRCSNGRLMVDFFAQAFGLPLLSPSLDKGGNFSQGVNFAVAGATALNVSTLAAKNISIGVQSSLLVQLDWFKSHLSTICPNPSDCKQKLEKALFLVGEIGGNDYNAAAFQGKSMDVLHSLVPDVVQIIASTVQEVINLGAKRVVVPGNFPVGCMTIYLAAFRANDSSLYDEVGCLKSWNDFAAFHNGQLQNAIKDLQTKNPGVTIVYGDYFSSLISVLKGAPSNGIDKDGLHKACCGSGDGDLNFDSSRMCGMDGVSACSDPAKRVSWDGIHLTEHTYQLMAEGLLKVINPRSKH